MRVSSAGAGAGAGAGVGDRLAEGTLRSSIGALPRSRRSVNPGIASTVLRGSRVAGGAAFGCNGACATFGGAATSAGAGTADSIAGCVGGTVAGARCPAASSAAASALALLADAAIRAISLSNDPSRLGVLATEVVGAIFGVVAIVVAGAIFEAVATTGRGRACAIFGGVDGTTVVFAGRLALERAATAGVGVRDTVPVATGDGTFWLRDCTLRDGGTGSARLSSASAGAVSDGEVSLAAACEATLAFVVGFAAADDEVSATSDFDDGASGCPDTGACAKAGAGAGAVTRAPGAAFATSVDGAVRGCARSSAARAMLDILRPNSLTDVQRSTTSGAPTAIAPAVASTSTAATASRRPRCARGCWRGGSACRGCPGEEEDSRRRTTPAGRSVGSTVHARRQHDAQRRREPGDGCRRRRGDRCHDRIAREFPADRDRGGQVGVGEVRPGAFEQTGVRIRRRCLAVMHLAQIEDQFPRRLQVRRRPALGLRRVVLDVLVRQVTLQHRREAVHVAAPVELARGLQVATAAGLERVQQPRRLVVVVRLPADGQRGREAFARHEREREVDQREIREARVAGAGPRRADRTRPGRPGCRRCRP